MGTGFGEADGLEFIPVTFKEFILELDPGVTIQAYQWSLIACKKHSMTSMPIKTPIVAFTQMGKPMITPRILPDFIGPITVRLRNTCC